MDGKMLLLGVGSPNLEISLPTYYYVLNDTPLPAHPLPTTIFKLNSG
jgi:hypothetical protein